MTPSWTVPEDAAGIRADKWISVQNPDTSRSLVQKAFEAGLVKVNGAPAAKSTRLRAGDQVEYVLMEPKEVDLTPVDLALEILYEDEHLLVVGKSSGLVVHPGAGTTEPTLVHGLLHHCRDNLSRIGAPGRPGIVHRLDRETSGIMVVAKTNEAHESLARAFAGRKVKKEYLALVSGIPDRLSGTIKKPIARHPRHRHKMSVREEGKFAHTDWELLGETEGPAALLLCRIHTGRTHQIRVHLADMGFPILGDAVYGYRANRLKLPHPPARIMLHAWRLELKHPIDGKRLCLLCDPPEDFKIQFPGLKQVST